jgi:DNA polymerase
LLFAREIDYNGGVDFLTIRLPSGRKLYYANPALTKNQWGGESISYARMDQTTKKWARVESYGGKLVENITQAVARDCLAHSMYVLSNAGYNIVMHIHDEVVIEVPASGAAEELKRICGLMSQEIFWANGLILNAEGFVGGFYKKEG